VHNLSDGNLIQEIGFTSIEETKTQTNNNKITKGLPKTGNHLKTQRSVSPKHKDPGHTRKLFLGRE
jgi:hypothetical protein